MTRNRVIAAVAAAAAVLELARRYGPGLINAAVDEDEAIHMLDALTADPRTRALLYADVADYWESVRTARTLTRADVIRFVADQYRADVTPDIWSPIHSDPTEDP